jgi:hypothetical protein
MFKFLSYLYSNAYELEYSLVHVMIMIYELAYSLCVMFLTCSSLFLIIHQVSMNRGRTRDEMTVRWAVVAAPNLACHSERVRSMGFRSCFQLHGRGARVCGDQRICGYLSGRGVGGSVVTALSILCNPPSGIPVGVL